MFYGETHDVRCRREPSRLEFPRKLRNHVEAPRCGRAVERPSERSFDVVAIVGICTLHSLPRRFATIHRDARQITGDHLLPGSFASCCNAAQLIALCSRESPCKTDIHGCQVHRKSEAAPPGAPTTLANFSR